MSDQLIYSIDDFVREIKEWDQDKVYTWVKDFLFKDCTAPLALAFPISSKTDFFIDIYGRNKNHGQSKGNLEKAVVKCYDDFSKNEALDLSGISGIGTELFQIIGKMELNELSNRLKQDAVDEKYKSIPTTNLPKEISDLHSYLLNALSGLKPKDIEGLTQLIERDIHDTRYSPECFVLAYKLTCDITSGLKYMPILVGQIQEIRSAVKSIIIHYIQALEKADLSPLQQQPSENLSSDELGAYSRMLDRLNRHVEGYALQISNSDLSIYNKDANTTKVIPLTDKTALLIRASLKYMTNAAAT